MTVQDIALPGRHGRRLFDLVARHRVAAAILVLLILPWLVPYRALAVNVLVYGLYAVGFNLLYGYTGLLSFGHAAFFGTGAYGCGIAISHFGVPWLPALVIGTLFAGLVGAVIGGLAIRTRGIYFAMVTLALAQCVYAIFYQSVSLTGGENGLRDVTARPITLFGWRLDLIDPTTKYFVVLVFVALALWFVSRVLDSPFGAVLEAVRENERRARACGYDVRATKFLSFVLSALVCGLAGGLSAIHLSVVPIDSLNYTTSGLVVMMTLLGGMGTFFGPFIGAGAFVVIEDVVTLHTEHWQLVAGAIFMACVLFFPRGIWGSLLHWARR
jgi:branched-chain amino acid transport system permease protein